MSGSRLNGCRGLVLAVAVLGASAAAAADLTGTWRDAGTGNLLAVTQSGTTVSG